MNKKVLLLIVFIVFVVVIIMVLSGGGDAQAVSSSAEAIDTAYYVEADGNFFTKIAKLCDDGCYYVINMVFGGIESIFNSFLGN